MTEKGAEEQVLAMERLPLIIMCVAFIAAYVFSVNVVYIVIACGVIGVIRTLLLKRRSGK